MNPKARNTSEIMIACRFSAFRHVFRPVKLMNDILFITYKKRIIRLVLTIAPEMNLVLNPSARNDVSKVLSGFSNHNRRRKPVTVSKALLKLDFILRTYLVIDGCKVVAHALGEHTQYLGMD
jgi:hypothetical protein